MFSRRDFIKTSAATLVALRLGCAWAADPEVTADSEHTYHALTEQDRSLLTVLTPIILAEALPADEDEAKLAVQETVRGIDLGITLMPAATQAVMRQFFDLLENQLLPDWTDPAKVEQFLQLSRAPADSSPESLALQGGIIGLLGLVKTTWYFNPRSWAVTGYAGPPALY